MSEVIKIPPELQKNLDLISAFKAQVDQLAQNCKSIKVTDEATLAICQQNMTKANSLDKSIKDKVKEIRKPYNDILDSISAVGNPLSTPLTEAVNHLKDQVLVWEKKQKEKQVILDYINGKVTDSLRKYFETAKTEKQCVDAINAIERHWPPPDKFGELNTLAVELRDKYIKLLKLKITAIQSGGEITDEPAIEAPKLVIITPTKNIRKTWTFELSDITKVPLEWLQLNEEKVKAYLSENKESLKDGGVVDGVKFYKKETVTS